MWITKPSPLFWGGSTLAQTFLGCSQERWTKFMTLHFTLHYSESRCAVINFQTVNIFKYMQTLLSQTRKAFEPNKTLQHLLLFQTPRLPLRFTRVSSITDKKQFHSEIRAHLRANFPKQPTSIFHSAFPQALICLWKCLYVVALRREVGHNEYMAQQSHLRAVLHWTSLYFFRVQWPDLSFSHLGLWCSIFVQLIIGKTPHFYTNYPFTFLLKLSQLLNQGGL